MKKVFQQTTTFIRFLESLWRCSGNKSIWRRFFVLVAILTVSAFAFQTLVHTYLVIPDRPFGSDHRNDYSFFQSSSSSLQSGESLKGGTPQKVHLTRTNSFISPDESNKLMESFSVEQENTKLEARVQKKTSGTANKKDRNLADVTKGAMSLSPQRHVPPKQKHIWLLPPNEALVLAKREIDHAPSVNEDPDLYAPIFRNISVFKRSYELMEMTLKVYIYRDGSRPIFHKPPLKGIYASEGWFMKLMEENKQFVTRDPEKAHLFYLPYSARQMGLTLYVAGSHDLKPLSNFLRDYVNMIAAKYPFWNRTHGSDHFLVACHDWGPYTVTGHNELAKNAIKALCNADLSERIFVEGRDVSLPETTIRVPRKPLRNLGGNRASLRPILAFFAGSMHGRVRPTLLKYWGIGNDEDMKIYKRLPLRVSQKMSYIQHMKSSKYCVCPMGFEVNSPRIVEAIYYECVPVIIADNFVLPFNEVLEWSAFSVLVAEKDIPRLKEILLSIPIRKYLTMQNNVKMVQKHFLWNPRPIKYDLFHMILHSIWFNKLSQIQT
ncbi:probable glycosyltransferase At5g25310 [Vigna radiata var. radiata]|uniref:Probable glycosyltransferase At5g25310 n=1 Tax=Vigna radiata var. radiata TaxID=3916 RepID=A0A1S3UWE9_VIGRR|nr:probable glycosyltransferase At5g25310 [Vigna radiata var. radiata]XP_014510407.1 probable glycosyltransferase At5g25310 [Vigna radiata var. radiata]